jgi:hypothetical protein
MSTPVPFPADVPFDHAAANEFVDLADRLLAGLERATAQRWQDGRRALQRCVGPFADDLADELARRCQEAAGLAEDLAIWRDRVLAVQAEATARQREVVAARAAVAHQAQIDQGELTRAGRG